MKQNLSLKFFLSIFMCLTVFMALADEKDLFKGSISGKVVTENNEPAENVSVILKDTKFGTVTDDDGEFHFRVPAGNYTLVISHTGYKSQEAEVIVKDGNTVNVPVFIIHPSANTLSDVKITGSKTNKFARKKSDDVAKMPLKDLENPQSYTTVGKELLQEQAIFTSDDAIKNVPGISTLWTATNRVGDGGSYFTLRGFSVQALLRNGLTGNVTTSIDATNLDKLEVIKGPSGTLYGSSLVSFGGLINRVTKKPFDGTAGEISYSGGNYNFNRVSIDYNTPLDTAKKALLRINSAYNNSGSFLDNGSAKSFVFDPSFTYKVNDRLTLSFDAEISHSVSTTPPIFYFYTSVADLGVTSADKLSIDYRKSYQNND